MANYGLSFPSVCGLRERAERAGNRILPLESAIAPAAGLRSLLPAHHSHEDPPHLTRSYVRIGLLLQHWLTTWRIQSIELSPVVPFHNGMTPLAVHAIWGFLPIHPFQRVRRRLVDITSVLSHCRDRSGRPAGVVVECVQDVETSSLATRRAGVTRSRRQDQIPCERVRE